MDATRVFPAEPKNLTSLRRFVKQAAEALQADREVIEDMILAVDEAVTNIIVHGYAGRPGDIEVRVSLEQQDLVVRISDRAPLFDPTEVPPPDLSMPLEQRRFGGLGVHFTRQFVDEVTYCEAPEGCNELTLRKAARAGSR